MLIDVGNYNILPHLFFFHFMGSLLVALSLSSKHPGKHSLIKSCLHSLCAAPSFGVILLNNNTSVLHLSVYGAFVFSCLLTIQLLLITYQHTRHVFYTIITLFFLWGTNIVIESIPQMYNALAPLTISYHYTLITEGLFHISSAIYMVLLPFTVYGCFYATQQNP